jgi:ATP-dependent phosphofructokinase / diphosphate-dependent phosphofructokinase
MKKIGILTAGGDCPGLNAAIRGVGKTAMMQYGMEVIGISSGFKGLIEKDYVTLDESTLSGILTIGGTILGTSREKPFKKDKSLLKENDKPQTIIKNYYELGLDCLVCIGGNGTLKTANLLSEAGLNVIGIPKTIDNDVWGTDISFGFDSAVSICTDAIDRLHTTGNSHKRIMVIEVMGHNAGWIALYSGIAGGGDIILVPEIDYDIKKIAKNIKDRYTKGKTYSIVVVAEGIEHPENKTAGRHIASLIEEYTGIETRETILGYIQRGGTPTPMDRVLATSFGGYAAKLIAAGNYGRMVTMRDNHIVSVPLSETAGKLKVITADNHLVQRARDLGVCFGD